MERRDFYWKEELYSRVIGERNLIGFVVWDKKR
jgi:hypothetical protein